MKEEIRYRWRIQWLGKWTTTKYHATVEQIQKEHPEAVAVEGTREVLMVAETDAEIAYNQRVNSASHYNLSKRE